MLNYGKRIYNLYNENPTRYDTNGILLREDYISISPQQ